MATASATPVLTVSVTGTTCTRSASVQQTTFDVYVDPCAALLSVLADQVRVDMSVPATSVLTCALVSVTVLSDGRRVYIWDVTATWTE